MKDILEVHEDVLTAHVIIDRLMREYTKTGYSVEKTSMISFKLIFPDGYVCIFWENGRIYQEIFEVEIA